jgi:hypothetical protein
MPVRRVYKGRKASLTKEQVKEIRGRVAAGQQKTGLTDEYGCPRETVVLSASLIPQRINPGV